MMDDSMQRPLVLAALLLVLTCASRAAAEPADAEQLFAVRVQPLLREKCWSCHGADPDKLEAGLDLTRRESMLRGGDNFQNVLLPGKAANSLLYLACTWELDDVRMPPKENDRLSEQQTRWIRDWINAGAPWPSAERIDELLQAHNAAEEGRVTVSTSGGLSQEWTQRRYLPENLWAYQPLSDHPRPAVSSTSPTHPVDVWIDAELRRREITPAPRADRRTLIRRATFDLLGLPPQPDDVAAFLADPAPDREAFATLIDRLLASPHYGEQWGRHWLDVVRYADTAGFANDYERPNAWRYRDYVIRSFNDDKPYKQFILEQLAGDELDPNNAEYRVAVGFLRMGPWEQTGMSVGRVTRQQFLDDVTDALGQVFLAHPLQCCRCHDHKFDPIPTRDYYRLQAVFATTQFAEPDAPFLPRESQAGFEQERRLLEQRIARFQKTSQEIAAKEEAAARQWYAERGLQYAPRSALLKRGAPEERIAPRHIGLSTEDFGLERIARKTLTRHNWELDRFRPIAFSVYSGTTPELRSVDQRLLPLADPSNSDGTLEETSILTGGDLFSPQEPVPPGVLSCLPGAEGFDIPTTIEGRRTALARWIARADNPLTVRSIVNRVWHYHFGRGIAANPNNFGAMGGKPTHPELLDELSRFFLEHDWSLKQLHRRIMTSDAYCRASTHDALDQVLAADPEFHSYAVFRPRRLAAEELRDSMLAVSGELNLQMGGIPVRPEIHLEAALQPRQIMGTYAPAYQPSPLPAQRHRRTIYAKRIRGLVDPFLNVFNQPPADKSCESREASTVTPQVFALLNGRQSYDRALAMAQRIRNQTDSPQQQVELAFLWALGRKPVPNELEDCLRHVQVTTERHEQITFTPQELPRSVVRHAVEEMNGQPFSFAEQLEVYEQFVPDKQPWDADAPTRGLAELCLVLINSNEFMYVP
jgi:hypothetical protein